MADFNKYIQFLAKVEGGLSADPRDTNPAKTPSSYVMQTGQFKGYKVHTNRGITFGTYRANASKVGLKPTTDAFINLTYQQAYTFYKKLFWDTKFLDVIISQGIAEQIAEAFVGSLVGGNKFIKDLQLTLKALTYPVKYTGKFDSQTINNLNNALKKVDTEKFLIREMTRKRLEYLKSLSNFKTYGRGWSTRLASTESRGLLYLG
jgi:lysozyme family protein